MKFFLFLLFLIVNGAYADCLRSEVTFGIPLDCELSKEEKNLYLGGDCTKDDNNRTACKIKTSVIKPPKDINLSIVYAIFDENLKKITKIIARGKGAGRCISLFQLIERHLELSRSAQNYHKSLSEEDFLNIYSGEDGSNIILGCYESINMGIKIKNQNIIYNFHYIVVNSY